MKDIVFIGDALKNIKSFPQDAKYDMGRELERVQCGDEPFDWKPMKSVGRGVREIRVRVTGGTYRTIYIATLPEAVYVLHAFQKKTDKTRQSDINLAAKRLADLRQKV